MNVITKDNLIQSIQDSNISPSTMPLEDMINEGVGRAYILPDNILRASILADPEGKRTNTKDNTTELLLSVLQTTSFSTYFTTQKSLLRMPCRSSWQDLMNELST